jgi:hypothetical protein
MEKKFNNLKTISNKIKKIFVIDFNSVISHINWIKNNRVNKHDFKAYPAKVICFDFSRCRFLKPYHISALACLIHEYSEKNFKIQLINIPEQIEIYLNKINFKQFCNKFSRNNFPDPIDTTLPLWLIDATGINLYPKEAQKYFENNYLQGKDLFILSNTLAELMNNVFDHSFSKIPGYTFTQFTSKNNQIITSLCDFGKGIPKNVNDFLKNRGEECLENDKALRKALETKFSTETKPHNRGFGLETISSNIKSIKGKILIISNDAFYCLYENGEIKSKVLNVNFPGTLIVITINTLNLNAKEEELNDELSLID